MSIGKGFSLTSGSIGLRVGATLYLCLLPQITPFVGPLHAFGGRNGPPDPPSNDSECGRSALRAYDLWSRVSTGANPFRLLPPTS